MYQHQLKKWGVSKNMKQKEKDEIMEMMAQEGVPQGELLSEEGVPFDQRTIAKLRRHARDKRRDETRRRGLPLALTTLENMGGNLSGRSMEKTYAGNQEIENTLMEGELETDIAGPSTTHQLSKLMSEEEYLRMRAQRSPSQSRVLLQVTSVLEYNSNEDARLKLGFPSSSIPPPPPVLRLSAHDAQFELVFQSLQELWKIISPSNLGKEPAVVYLGPEQPSQASHFWNSIRHGVHIFNASSLDSLERAWPMIMQALQVPADAIVEQPLYFIKELFVTLSPARTSMHEEIRTMLWNHICSANLQVSHPMGVIACQLLKSGYTLELSLRTLSALLEMFTSTFGWANHASLELRRVVIATLRKMEDFEQASDMARHLLQASREEFGHRSLEARLSAAEWSHVLIDTEDYYPAAKLSLSVILQPDAGRNFFGPRFHDNHAVYAMEDMANMHAKLGEVEASIVWLEMAAQDAWDLWQDDVVAAYIFDKLDPLLRQCGRTEDAEWYKKRFQTVE